MMKKILLLGSDELGEESVVSAQRRGQYITVCGSYAGVPAIQAVDEFETFDMLNSEELEHVVEEHRPDIIVPEIEAIRAERLYDFEKEGIQVVPSTRAVNFTMNHKATRDPAAQKLGLKIARYSYARTLEEPREVTDKIGFPCVVRPLMFSSGKGQPLVRSVGELEHTWEYEYSGSCGDIRKLIVEKSIKFDSGITPLTVTQKSGPALFCPPIGHVQEDGDYREDSQSAHIDPTHLKEVERMTEKITRALIGAGLRGVEFFLSRGNGVHFSELSSRSYDTGVVTLASTQNLNEFESYLRAVFGLPIPGIKQEWISASAVIFSPIASQGRSQYRGLEEVTREKDTYLRIFGKSFIRVSRRMNMVSRYVPFDSDSDALCDKTKRIAEKVEVR